MITLTMVRSMFQATTSKLLQLSKELTNVHQIYHIVVKMHS